MNTLDHIVGATGSGHHSCVPYTVNASSSGWVASASWIAQNQRRGASATRPWPKRRNSHHTSQPTSGSTNSEWLKLRCTVISVTGSSLKSMIGSESRSGRVPSAAPASRAARRWRAGATAAAMAPPSRIWVRESMGEC